MRNPTRIVYNAYMLAIAQLSGVPSAAEKFTVAPTVQQTMETRIQESSEFLTKINNIGVTEQSGEKLGVTPDWRSFECMTCGTRIHRVCGWLALHRRIAIH